MQIVVLAFVFMMEYNKSLKEYNTFGLDCTAKEYVEFANEDDLPLIKDLFARYGELLILAGGSNTVFKDSSFEGCVLRVCNKGIEVLEEDENEIVLRVAAGEVWREFVLWACKKNYCGLENLAAIYGTVGAAPVQNIGAYGAQVADYIEWVESFDMSNGEIKRFYAKDCQFDYRFSRWKKDNKNELICYVAFRLKKAFTPQLSYSAISQSISEEEAKNLTAERMCEIITEIRNSKLPDVKTLGNVGSFFKNPTVSKAEFERLKQKDENIVWFEDKNGVKLSAAYLIQSCGFKGKRFGNVGMHAKQALVLVNYGQATGEEIHNFAKHVIDTVKQTFDVDLEIEAHIVGNTEN